jgi:multiple sugar transport system ATP-binding protein
MRRIELRHVTKRFGRVVAVHDLTLVIDPGSFVTVLGPSGCGKTTVLRMIAGLEDPDGGEILIDGHPVFSQREGIYVPPARRGLGMVFQSYALWPHMTVFENVAFGLALARRPSTEVKTRVAEVLVSLQLTGLESRYPQEISGGQQQRVALARMLATSPDIFLLDEPLSNLDARLRTDMRSELKRLHRDTRATIVYVTHDQLEALTLSTHVAVMSGGVLCQYAPPDAVYRRPATVFVADFVGSPKMNLVPARVRDGGAGRVLDFGTFEVPCPTATAAGDVIVGIRPESIGLALEPQPGAVEFQTYSVLPAGAELIVTARRGELHLTIRETRPLSIDMDRPVWLSFSGAGVTLYDPTTSALIG